MPQHLRQEPSAVVLRAGICAGGAGQPASLPQTCPVLGCGRHDPDSPADRRNRVMSPRVYRWQRGQ